MKYYKIADGQIDNEKSTDKSFAIIVGDNQSVLHFKYYYHFVAHSILKIIDNEIFAPAWLAIKEIKSAIEWNNFIEIKEEKKECKPRITKEQKQLKEYNMYLNSHFNFEVPNEYIEFWFEDDNMPRFTTVDKLEGRLEKSNITKINIVRNGQREIIRG